MNVKTMEGIVGARTNLNVMNTPMRVYKDARRRGDWRVMERAMEYAGDFADKAREYEEKADIGMEEEAKEVREKIKAEFEEAIEKRQEERKEQTEQVQEQRQEELHTDTVEISEEGNLLFQDTLLPSHRDGDAKGKAPKPQNARMTGPLVSGGTIDVGI